MFGLTLLHGLKLGLYYSQSLDWHEKNGAGYTEISDHENNFGSPRHRGNCWDFPNPPEKNYAITFENKIKPQVKELMTNYGDICLIWFDTPMLEQTAEQTDELYNLVKKYQPNCLVNSRIGNGFGDYYSCGDNEISYRKGSNTDSLAECPATLNSTWGFKYFDNDYKSSDEIIDIKNRLNENGINYLLNVGPDHLGRIPTPATEISDKSEKNSNDIYLSL